MLFILLRFQLEGQVAVCRHAGQEWGLVLLSLQSSQAGAKLFTHTFLLLLGHLMSVFVDKFAYSLLHSFIRFSSNYFVEHFAHIFKQTCRNPVLPFSTFAYIMLILRFSCKFLILLIFLQQIFEPGHILAQSLILYPQSFNHNNFILQFRVTLVFSLNLSLQAHNLFLVVVYLASEQLFVQFKYVNILPILTYPLLQLLYKCLLFHNLPITVLDNPEQFVTLAAVTAAQFLNPSNLFPEFANLPIFPANDCHTLGQLLLQLQYLLHRHAHP